MNVKVFVAPAFTVRGPSRFTVVLAAAPPWHPPQPTTDRPEIPPLLATADTDTMDDIRRINAILMAKHPRTFVRRMGMLTPELECRGR
jgi:hypothetical protein